MLSSSHLSLKRIITTIVLVWTILNHVEASSAPQRPIKRLAVPSIHALEILPRKTSFHQTSDQLLHPRSVPVNSPEIQHSDSLRLTLSVFGRSYHLHLSPNPHLFHPSARINYFKTGPDGQTFLDRTEPLLGSDVKAYWGDVVHPDISHGRLREDTVGGVINSSHRPSGWARIMVHHQGDIDAGVPPIFEGAFSSNGDVYHVVTKENYLRTKHPLDPHIPSSLDDHLSSLVIFRDSDIISPKEEKLLRRANMVPSSQDQISISAHNAKICSHDDLRWNKDPWMNPILRKPQPPTWFEKIGFQDDAILNFTTPFKRDDIAGSSMETNFAGHIGQTAGCPISQQIIYMGVAADCKYVQQNGSPQNATTSILNDWNMASALYKSTFNVSLGIIELDMHDTTCPQPPDRTRPWNVDCGDVTLNDRLSLFSQWRGNKGSDGAGVWHLMSGCPTGTEVGVAWLGTLCQTTAGGSPGNVVSGTSVSTAGRAEWQVVAHEIGHVFGAIHDCTAGCNVTSPCCPLSTDQCDTNSQFLMSPTSSTDEAKFSQCSLGNICTMLMRGSKMNTTCLQPPDPKRQTLSLQMCGNGIVEAGEDCDPGKGANTTCCDPKTCKFTRGSVCDPLSSTCCTQQCQFAPSTEVCRPAQDDRCDIPEFCTGNSSSCPWDVTKPNGQSCGPDGLACASGKCTSLAMQCQTIGAAMGLKAGCPNKGDTSCQVSCQDPNQLNQCIVLQAQMVDGSPCGFGGSCVGGRCKPGNLLDTAKSWFLQNLQISIPVTVIIGLLALFFLYGLFRCCFPRRPRPISTHEPALNSIPPQRLHSWSDSPEPLIPQTEERVWTPPPPGAVRNGRSNYGAQARLNNIPSALKAGPQGSRDSPYRPSNRRYPGPTSQQGSRGGSNWVDPSAWNGRS